MAIANYHVSLKVLLRKEDEFLMLVDTSDDRLELPGGRIDETEHKSPFEKIIAREVKEELGDAIRYRLGKIAFSYRRHFENRGFHVLINVYEAEYLSGEINISDEHCGFKWVDPKKVVFKREQFFSDEEYIAFKNYFNK